MECSAYLISLEIPFTLVDDSTFSIELLQQFLKELSAWGLFMILFALAINQFPQKEVRSSL